MTASTRPRRVTTILEEAVRGLRAQWVTSVLVAVVAAAVAVLAAATAGRSDASRQAVLDTVDGLGSALLVVSDLGDEPVLDERFVADLAGVAGVTWAFGVGPVVDVTNAELSVGAGGVPMRPLLGGMPAELALRGGRAPAAGEAVVGERAQAALRMAGPTGGVAHGDGRTAVVGGLGTLPGLERLADLVLVVPPGTGDHTRVLHVYVRVDDPGLVAAVADVVRGMVPEGDAGALTVETSEGVVALRSALSQRLDRDAAVLLGTVLGAGAVIAFLVTWMSTMARRTDLGRRRALGSTRSAAVSLALLHTGLAALAGGTLGTLVGGALAMHAAGRAPSAGFLVALLALTVLSLVAGCVVPAVVAARSDPVRVLRVP